MAININSSNMALGQALLDASGHPLVYDVQYDQTTRVMTFLSKSGAVIYSCTIPQGGGVELQDFIDRPLMLYSTQNGSTVQLNSIGTWDAGVNLFQTSSDNSSWTDYDGSTISLDAGQYVYIRRKIQTDAYIASSSVSCYSRSDRYFQFVMTGQIEAYNNCSSIIARNCLGSTSQSFLTYYAFFHLFDGCSALKRAPLLPYTGSLASASSSVYFSEAQDCAFAYMFKGTSLTHAPRINATSITSANPAKDFFRSMYEGCASLTEAHCAVVPSWSPSFLYKLGDTFTDWLPQTVGTLYADNSATSSHWKYNDNIPSSWTLAPANTYPY